MSRAWLEVFNCLSFFSSVGDWVIEASYDVDVLVMEELFSARNCLQTGGNSTRDFSVRGLAR